MTHVTLPYNLQDGQRAYAARIMADLQALAGQLNQVSVEGLAPGDLEYVLLQLKLMLDQLTQDRDRAVQELRYDSQSCRLELELRDGASFSVDMRPFLNVCLGSQGESVGVGVDADGRISAWLQPGSVGPTQLSAALQSLINGKITAGAAGNAEQVRFSDGQSFQDKLDAGQLKGADGVSASVDGLYYFRYEPLDGHLYLGVADGAGRPPFSINGSGHLIYTIE